jgi:hypothetical protein
VQALALQKIGVIPDKFILLNRRNQEAEAGVKSKLINKSSPLNIDDTARRAIEEYNLHI